MFRSFVSLLTLLAMVLHASLGCCWHHAHAQGTGCCQHEGEVQTVTESPACTCSHSTAHHQTTKSTGTVDQADSSPGNHHDHHHGNCDQGTCKYLPANSLEIPTPSDDPLCLNWLPALDSLSLQSVAGIHGNRWWADTFLAQTASPCVRDLTQVWLL
ncbi:MAG: hypothetical protein KDA84_25405 [Planctomycetaceae bacterium]|nr:hypothetical protein [Planctomycetaceae bacterium]